MNREDLVGHHAAEHYIAMNAGAVLREEVYVLDGRNFFAQLAAEPCSFTKLHPRRLSNPTANFVILVL